MDFEQDIDLEISKIIKRLYFKLLQFVSFNTMMLIGMKSSDNWTFFDHIVGSDMEKRNKIEQQRCYFFLEIP